MQWLDKAVVKHKDIVEVVMRDPGLRADLLRLYHQAAEAQCPATHSARVETLQLFTNIMIKLLETQGQTPHDLGQVLCACQSDATHDQSRSGKRIPPYSVIFNHVFLSVDTYQCTMNNTYTAAQKHG